VNHCWTSFGPGAVQLVLHNALKSFHFLRVPTNPRPSPEEKNHKTVQIARQTRNGENSETRIPLKIQLIEEGVLKKSNLV